jgi:hypothetical protein
MAGSAPVEFGTDRVQYFGSGTYRFHPTGLFSPEDLSGHHENFVVIVDDGALGKLAVSSRLSLYSAAKLGTDPSMPGEILLVGDMSNTGGRIKGCHIWGSECEYPVIHLQMKDYPLILGYDMKGGLPKNFPSLIREWFRGQNIGIMAIILVGLQADATVLAESNLPGVEMGHAIQAAKFVMSEYAANWEMDNCNPLLVGLIGVGTKQLWLPSDQAVAQRSLADGK